MLQCTYDSHKCHTTSNNTLKRESLVKRWRMKTKLVSGNSSIGCSLKVAFNKKDRSFLSDHVNVMKILEIIKIIYLLNIRTTTRNICIRWKRLAIKQNSVYAMGSQKKIKSCGLFDYKWASRWSEFYALLLQLQCKYYQ